MAKDALFLDALSCRNLSGRPPVWLMRQAGRYMHEYQALRKKYDFLALCKTPELIYEVTMQPITAFGFDAAIVFSDILLILEEFGFRIAFPDGKGPQVYPKIEARKDIEELIQRPVEVGMDYLRSGIASLKLDLPVPLLGFAAAPLTLASYLIEEKPSQSVDILKRWMCDEPELFQKLLDFLARVTNRYLAMQIDAGVDAVQLFESSSIYLDPKEFQRFSIPAAKAAIYGLEAPVIFFSRNSVHSLSQIVDMKPKGIGCDWMLDLAGFRREIPSTIAIQGNLHPELLLSSRDVLEQEVMKLLNSMKEDSGYIFNLGHGILPNTPREHVELLVDRVQSFGR